MSVLSTYSDARATWAVYALLTAAPGSTLEFIAPDVIRIGGGPTWASVGMEVGMRTQTLGTISNDGLRIVESISSADLTTGEVDVVNEGPVSGGQIVEGVNLYTDTLELWPIELQASIGTLEGITLTGFPWSVTINSIGADAAFGVDDYDWWLSQRTEDPAKQYLSIVQRADTGGDSFSGTVEIDITALGTAEFGVSSMEAISVADAVKMFRRMAIYVRRRSDGAWQWRDILVELVT